MARLVGVTESAVSNVNLAAMHLTVDRLAGKLLEAEVNGCFDQRHAAELHIAAGKDLAGDWACCANHEI